MVWIPSPAMLAGTLFKIPRSSSSIIKNLNSSPPINSSIITGPPFWNARLTAVSNSDNEKALGVLNFGKAGKYKFNFEKTLDKKYKLKNLITGKKDIFENMRQTIELDKFSKGIYILK